MSTRQSLLALFLAFPVLLMSAAASAELSLPYVRIYYSAAVEDGGEYWFETAGTPLGVFDFRSRLCSGCEMWSGSAVDVAVYEPDDKVWFAIDYTTDGSGNIVDGPVELADTFFLQVFDVEGTSLFGDAVIQSDVLIELAEVGTGTLSGSTITWDTQSYWAQTIGIVDCTGGLCAFAGPWPVISHPDLLPPEDPNDDNPQPLDLPTFTVSSFVDDADYVVSDNGTPGDFTDDLVAVDPGGNGTAYNTWYGQEAYRFVPEPGSTLLLVAGVAGLAVIRRTRP